MHEEAAACPIFDLESIEFRVRRNLVCCADRGMRLENAKSIVELDVERVFPAHLAHVFDRGIFRGSEWDLGVLSRFQNRPSPRNSLNKIDNLPIDRCHIHRFHGLQIHTRNDFTIVVEHMHVSRRMIANLPDEI